MELFQAVANSIVNTKASLWPGFAPELILSVTILVLLTVRMLSLDRILRPFLIVLVGSLLALYYAFPLKYVLGTDVLVRQELFTGMLVYDAFSVYVRSILLVFAVLFAVFTSLTGVPDREGSTDFYCLVLGATIGMCLMATANHLLIVFLAVEMASVPSYALAATGKGRKEASEAALKYSMYGAGAAGVMLYGISLLAGMVGSAHLPTIALQLAEMLPSMAGSEKMVLTLAAIMITVGLAFKLSAVPFHFWCPDVFEGASAEVNAFLSIASKAAALALVVRMSIGLGVLPTDDSSVLAYAETVPTAGLMSVVDDVNRSPASVQLVADEEHDESVGGALESVRMFMALLWACIAAVTCTFGNLAAYGQTNIKRLLAYSTIAHAGYMLLPIPAALALYGHDTDAANRAIGSLGMYMAIYLFMNLAAFAIVAFLRNAVGSEQISDYGGLIRRYPTLVVCMGIVMFSLVGIPPLAGFVGKFAIFAALMEGYNVTGYTFLLVLLIVGGLNTVISLFYYLRVVRVMAIEPETHSIDSGWSMISLGGAFIVLVTMPLLILFVNWGGLSDWTTAATRHLF